jgi:hypothetical protein
MATSFIQYGLGPIGCSICRLALERGFRMAGAIDIDPGKAGKDVGEVIGLGKKTGIVVSGKPEEVLELEADVVFHSTSSSLGKIKGQVIGSVKSGKNVISTAEELSFPLDRKTAAEIGEEARKNRVSVLGTGVNPGFVLDKLILVMTGACQEIEMIKAKRVVDASKRRLPLQKKIGAGMTAGEFDNGVKSGMIRHVGLPESVSMIANGLGHDLERIEEKIEPVMPEGSAGKVLGVRQVCRGFRSGKAFIELELRMYLGAEKPEDYIRIEGKPSLELKIPGGIHGDIATPAIVVNAAEKVMKAKPGLLTMLDIPVSFGGVPEG